jgi:hypothetical protein
MAIAIPILIALACTALSVTMFRANKASQIVMSTGVYVSLIAATITLVDAKIREKEVPNNSAVQALMKYETYLNDPPRLESKDSWYKVGLMGDSTAVSQEDTSDIMPEMLEQTLRITRKADLELYYLHFAGLDAFSYYQLVHRMLEDDVQLIVIPVNLRSFGPSWRQNTPNFMTMMNSYVPLSDLPFLFSQGSKSDINMSHVLLDKLDASWFDRRYHKLKNKAVFEYRKLQTEYTASFKDYFPAPPEEHRQRLMLSLLVAAYPREGITKHHPYIPMFKRINALAAEHNAKIVYYTVQVNPAMIAPDIFEPDPIFESCREFFGTGDHIYFEDITNLLPEEHFGNFSHLKKDGLQMVADALADRIIAIKNEDIPQTPVD